MKTDPAGPIDSGSTPSTYPTNYRLKDGDSVILLEHTRVDGYWYDPVYNPWGSWDSFFVLRGTEGVVVKARTPCVLAPRGRTAYFANIDVMIHGRPYRVRVGHDKIKRLPPLPRFPVTGK